MTSRNGWMARALAPAAAAVFLAGLAVTPAHAGPHAPAWQQYLPHASARQQYLEQPANSNVRPVSATVLSGSVANPGGLAQGGHGTTTLTVTPAETGQIVSVSGATLTLKAPLAQAHPAGASVTSTPGAITGDSAFQPRDVSLPVTGTGTLSSGFMGGFRFEAITLTTPGTLV